MGEAKTRRQAIAWGKPLEQDFHVCPSCRSRDTVVEMTPTPMGLSHVPTLMGVCRSCKAFWEAFPPGWKHDAVEGEPCDNCAFKAGSPESQDKAEWASMLAKLKHGQEFRCHKGAPMQIDPETKQISFDEAWVQRHGRMCAGFLKAMQQWPDWLEHRFRGTHVLTVADQDKLLGGPA